MIREYRGWFAIEDRFIYGYAVKRKYMDKDRYFIVDEHKDLWLVEPDSIGQWTGLKDANGVKIFEGDIVAFNRTCEGSDIGYSQAGVVKLQTYEDGKGYYDLKDYEEYYDLKHYGYIVQGKGEATLIAAVNYKGVVIGNIYQNPEFLESTE